MQRPVLPAQPPTEVAPSYQPTEVAPSSYQPTEVAPSYQPTEVASSYQPTEVAPSSYQPTEVASSYQPTEVASSYQPTVPANVPPSQEPTTVSPRPQGAPPRSSPTVTTPQIRPNADPREQPTAPPAGPSAPPAPPTNFDRGSPLGPAPARSPQSPELMRYGPGVPPSQASVSAEQVWRTGHMPEPPPRRPVRYRALASLALTVILLAAAGVLLFLRFHHSPFKVTGVPILSTAQNGCTVNVTGQIPTNGSSGTISYQWVFTPQQGAPQPLSQSVVSGQHDVFVTVAVQGQGHGTASEKVTLQILGRNQESISTVVKVSC
jgi:hypothetical protein